MSAVARDLRALWWAPGMAAVVVTAVIAGSAFLVGTTPQRPLPSPTAAPSISADRDEHAIVPWRPLPATHPEIPAAGRPGRGVTSAFAGVRADWFPLSDPTPGSRYAFVVTLVSLDGDLRLRTCPDFSIEQPAAKGRRVTERYGLNCGAVPYRDRDGVPVLPLGLPVRFEIETMLSPHAGSRGWRLEIPEKLTVHFGYW